MDQKKAAPKKKKKKPSSKAQQGNSAGLTFLLILMIVILLLVILLSDPKDGNSSGGETADKGTAAWQEEDLPGNKKPADQDADAEKNEEKEDEIRLPQKDEVTIQKGEDGYKIPEVIQSSAPDYTPPPPSETTHTSTQQQTQQSQQSQQTQQQSQQTQQQQQPQTPPPFVPRTIGSGSFRSSTGVNLNLVTKWTCTTTDSGNATLKLDFYVESYTIYASACPGALAVTAYGVTSTLGMPDISLETSVLTQTHVGSKTYNISITDGNTANVPVNVKWYFGGVYSGVDLSVIESGADLFLSR